MKRLLIIVFLVCYLALVAEFHRVDTCIYPFGVCAAAAFAGTIAGSMTDPLVIWMALVCLAIGAKRERFLVAAAVSAAFSIVLAIDLYSYWTAIGVISVPVRWMHVLLTYLFIGSIAFWVGLGLRAILKPNAVTTV